MSSREGNRVESNEICRCAFWLDQAHQRVALDLGVVRSSQSMQIAGDETTVETTVWKLEAPIQRHEGRTIAVFYLGDTGLRAEVSIAERKLKNFPNTKGDTLPAKRERTERVLRAILECYVVTHPGCLECGRLLRIDEDSVDLNAIAKEFPEPGS